MKDGMNYATEDQADMFLTVINSTHEIEPLNVGSWSDVWQ